MAQSFMTCKEAAKSLGVRLGTLYGLIWDEVIAAKKATNGAWLVDAESVERYRVRRNLRRTTSREVIDVVPTQLKSKFSGSATGVKNEAATDVASPVAGKDN